MECFNLYIFTGRFEKWEMRLTVSALKSSHEILNVPLNPTRKQVKTAYLKLSKKYHPDVYHDDGEKFKEIQKAYEFFEKTGYGAPIKSFDYKVNNFSAKQKREKFEKLHQQVNEMWSKDQNYTDTNEKIDPKIEKEIRQSYQKIFNLYGSFMLLVFSLPVCFMLKKHKII